MVLSKREEHSAAKPRFSVIVNRFADTAVLHCSGRLCYQGEVRLLADTAQSLLSGGTDLVLDLGAIELLDSAGIGQLVLISMQAQALGRAVCIACATDGIRELLGLTNVASLFEFFSSVDEALSAGSERVA